MWETLDWRKQLACDGVRGPPVRELLANSTGAAQRESTCPVLAYQMAGDLLMVMQGNETALQ